MKGRIIPQNGAACRRGNRDRHTRFGSGLRRQGPALDDGIAGAPLTRVGFEQNDVVHGPVHGIDTRQFRLAAATGDGQVGMEVPEIRPEPAGFELRPQRLDEPVERGRRPGRAEPQDAGPLPPAGTVDIEIESDRRQPLGGPGGASVMCRFPAGTARPVAPWRTASAAAASRRRVSPSGQRAKKRRRLRDSVTAPADPPAPRRRSVGGPHRDRLRSGGGGRGCACPRPRAPPRRTRPCRPACRGCHRRVPRRR